MNKVVFLKACIKSGANEVNRYLSSKFHIPDEWVAPLNLTLQDGIWAGPFLLGLPILHSPKCSGILMLPSIISSSGFQVPCGCGVPVCCGASRAGVFHTWSLWMCVFCVQFLHHEDFQLSHRLISSEKYTFRQKCLELEAAGIQLLQAISTNVTCSYSEVCREEQVPRRFTPCRFAHKRKLLGEHRARAAPVPQLCPLLLHKK